MSDFVLLACVAMACLTVAFGVWAWRSSRNADGDVRTLKTSAELLARQFDGIDSRVKRVESKLQLDGSRLTAEAQRAALPAMMR